MVPNSGSNWKSLPLPLCLKNPPIKGAPKKLQSSISKALGRIPRLFLMMPSVSKKLLFMQNAVFDFVQKFMKKYLSF
jgi:hypothetical protein